MTDQLPATVQGNRTLAAQRTPEGAIALRQMTSSGVLMVDEADLPHWITPVVRAALPAALAEAQAMIAPALGRDFTRLVTSSLVLVAGVGMTREDSRAWQAAAAEALSGIPADLLEIGCAAAKRTCDHPSKIVPTILATVGHRWDARRADLTKLRRIAAAAENVAEGVEVCSPEQAREILTEHGMRSRSEAPTTEPAAKPEPTVADYVALGLTEDEARQAIADRERMLRRSPAKPFASAATAALNEAARAA